MVGDEGRVGRAGTGAEGERKERDGGVARAGLEFSYRHSSIPSGGVIISAEFRLKKTEKNVIIKNLTESLGRRGKTQPVGFRNAGCVFKNPPDNFAAKLIDEAGLKGAKTGGAEVSVIHANFINNTGGASAADVLSLIEKIKLAVKQKSGIALESEIEIIGEE